ncbi:MAG: hypothetical protein ACI93R_001274 [Flavobacteriales bacterium]|jgi:hypothetical protein
MLIPGTAHVLPTLVSCWSLKLASAYHGLVIAPVLLGVDQQVRQNCLIIRPEHSLCLAHGEIALLLPEQIIKVIWCRRFEGESLAGLRSCNTQTRCM